MPSEAWFCGRISPKLRLACDREPGHGGRHRGYLVQHDEPVFWDADAPPAAEQLALVFDAADLIPLAEDPDPRAGTLIERAERFHALNPQVYRMACRVLRYMRDRGLPRFGIGAAWEILRFRYLETTGDVYKLNNNYRAFYARRILEREPDLAGFLTTRDCPHDSEYRTRPARPARQDAGPLEPMLS
jgi:hypothetical protein